MNVDLSALKDIHTPSVPNLFPLAWGWWLVIVGVFLAFLGLYFMVIYFLESPQRYVIQQLKKIKTLPPEDFIRQINALTKQVAIARYGREAVAPLSGNAWISFLNKRTDDRFSKEYVDLFEKIMYSPNKELLPSERQVLFDKYEKWILTNLKEKREIQ